MKRKVKKCDCIVGYDIGMDDNSVNPEPIMFWRKSTQGPNPDINMRFKFCPLCGKEIKK